MKQNCQEITSPTYRKLCQTLSIPNIRQTGKRFGKFTGTIDVDILILKELDDEDLINVCAVNTYINDLCNRDSFWRARTLDKFGMLGNVEKLKEGTTWKQYYLHLSGLLEHNELTHANIPDITFNYPVFVNENLLSFLKEGNFGPSVPSNPDSPPLKNFLSVMYRNIH